MNSIYDGRLLVVDDNEELCRMLTDMLHREGFRQVYTAGTCAQALSFFETAGGQAEMPDLVILDINLPDGDGFSLMQKIRMRSQTPVLFLSARDEDNDRLLGLGLGADDYIVKPFGIKELCARVRAVLRRTARSQEPEQKLEAGTLQVDIARHTVTKNGSKIELTAKEFDLLAMLMKNRGKVLTRDSLLDKVWGVEYFGDTRTVDVHVRYLRQKVEDDPDHPVLIQTVRGVGYRFSE